LRNRQLIEDSEYSLLRIESEEEFNHDRIKAFDCGERDLNEYFTQDALAHHTELLATTYFFQPKRATEEGVFFPVALVSFMNDSLKLSTEDRKSSKKKFYKKFRKNMPFPKRGYKEFPAVKIGRLGVCAEYQKSHIGSRLINLTKKFFITNNKTGCRYLVVDAYNNPDQCTINFYKKNGFDFLSESDVGQKTRTMWFDLISYK